MKICVFTGTRAEYGLLYWLLKDLQSDPYFDLKILVSGTHLSPEFGETYTQIEIDGFHVDEKVEMLLSSNSAAGTAKSIGVGVLGFTDALSRLEPDGLILLGDRFEALAAAQTALILRIPVIHLHGGEITEGAYDDSIRHAITKLSYLHATSSDEHRNRVIQLGEAPNRVFNTGAIGLDHISRGNFMTLSEISKSLNFEISKDYFVVTYHPVTLADEPPEVAFLALLNALDIFENHQVILTYPNADDGGRIIISMIDQYAADRTDRICAIPSLGRTRYLSAVKHSSAVIGNSSSGIIEVPSLGVPTINVGSRQLGRLASNSVINCDPDKSAIVSTILSAIGEGDKVPLSNPYGEGDASRKIIDILKTVKFKKTKKFFDIKAGYT
ncbi:UDP-N-acetylglucosamine 2-epimerase [Amylibacter sp.]|nr:UDP-N-acetylglucosamine 2-epimerase [Amylibacter sp.]